MRRIVGFAGLLIALITTAPLAHATLLDLGLGGGTLATSIPSLPAGSIIDTTVPEVQTATSSNGGVWSASLQTVVYQETGTGMLDFLYQYKTLTSSNGSAPDELAVSNFLEPILGVGYLTQNLSGMSGGSVAPVSIVRNGGTVDFNFCPLPGVLACDVVAPGDTTFTLVVQVAATSVAPGFISLQDGGNANFDGFEPGSVPEPAGIVLFGTAFAMTAFFLRRRLVPKA